MHTYARFRWQKAWLHHRLFQHETSFDKDELTVVWQTINVEHACHYCVPAHTGIAKMMKVDQWPPAAMNAFCHVRSLLDDMHM